MATNATGTEPGALRDKGAARSPDSVAAAVSIALGGVVEAGVASAPRLEIPKAPQGQLGRPEGGAGDGSESVVSRARRKLWQLPAKYHCSLLGVCLELDEMRALAGRIGFQAHGDVHDFHLHHQLCDVAANDDRAGRRLHRYLDAKYASHTRSLRPLRTPRELRDVWRQACAEDDLGGSYWALLTHPDVTEPIANDAFADIHMLSHTASTALRRAREHNQHLNRKLTEHAQQLARERAARVRLAERNRLLEQAARRRDEHERLLAAAQGRVERLEAALRTEPSNPGEAAADGGHGAELREIRARLCRALEQVAAWRRRCRDAERRLRRLQDPGCSTRRRRPDDDHPPRADESPSSGSQPDLDGRLVVYVGGRAKVVPRLRAVTERLNGRFVHHDGGMHERAGRLDACIAGADIVVVPLDCVSHDASLRLKRHARRLSKPILWLPSASLSAYESALQAFGEGYAE